jgi:hypothetical protein
MLFGVLRKLVIVTRYPKHHQRTHQRPSFGKASCFQVDSAMDL